MRSRCATAFLAVAPFLIVSIAAAQEPAALQLSLEEALLRADSASPLMRRVRRATEVVAAQRVGAGVLLPANPVASVNLGKRSDSSGSQPPSDGFEWGVRLEQAIDVAGQRGTRLTEVTRAIQVATARERLARVETRARIRVAYVGALIANAYVESAREREVLAGFVLSSARQRVQSGAASDVESNLAEAELGRTSHERIEAELGAAEAENELRRILDIPVSTPIRLTSALVEPTLPTKALEQLLEEAQARREELRTLEAERSQLDASIIRLRREVVPSLTVFIDYMREQPGQMYIGAGLAVALPVWRHNQGQLAVVRAEQARTDDEIAIAQREIAIEVARLYRASLTRRDEAKLWTERIIPAAQANVDLVNQGWRAGKFDLFRVVQVTRDAADARRKELEVLGQLWQSVIELDRAVGVL